MSIIQIDSNTKLQDTEHHFKVSAGPGAGKTHWLVEHIRNVLHHSIRLGKIRKIACITYTNIAVETILTRLGMMCAELAGDFHLGDSRQLTDKSLLPFDLVS
ncbi:UvrD-helicase domain-containing protein [Acinetobacter guillouiae]|uniref:UvrD-helicase domain-containing protein n=1 Tax=Acinetobacter guillouiae TaxID=106649 RepID=UPI003AF45E41